MTQLHKLWLQLECSCGNVQIKLWSLIVLRSSLIGNARLCSGQAPSQTKECAQISCCTMRVLEISIKDAHQQRRPHCYVKILYTIRLVDMHTRIHILRLPGWEQNTLLEVVSRALYTCLSDDAGTIYRSYSYVLRFTITAAGWWRRWVHTL